MKAILIFTFALLVIFTANAQDSLFTRKQNRLYHTLEVTYISLNTADGILTHYAITRGAREVSPIFRDIVTNKPLFILLKGTFTIGALALIRQVRKHDHKTAVVYLVAANILYSIVVANNISVSIKL